MKDKLDYLLEKWGKPIKKPDYSNHKRMINDSIKALKSPKEEDKVYVFGYEAVKEIETQLEIEYTRIDNITYMITKKER